MNKQQKSRINFSEWSTKFSKTHIMTGFDVTYSNCKTQFQFTHIIVCVCVTFSVCLIIWDSFTLYYHKHWWNAKNHFHHLATHFDFGLHSLSEYPLIWKREDNILMSNNFLTSSSNAQFMSIPHLQLWNEIFLVIIIFNLQININNNFTVRK